MLGRTDAYIFGDDEEKIEGGQEMRGRARKDADIYDGIRK